MKKNIWTALRVSWLVLAMVTAHNSILALTGNGGNYCSGYCVSDDDCLAPCRCNILDSSCYYPG